MKTKESIWATCRSRLHPQNDITAAVYPAMDEYAKQMSTVLLIWIGKSGWTRSSDGPNVDHWWCNPSEPGVYLTDVTIYDKFYEHLTQLQLK